MFFFFEKAPIAKNDQKQMQDHFFIEEPKWLTLDVNVKSVNARGDWRS